MATAKNGRQGDEGLTAQLHLRVGIDLRDLAVEAARTRGININEYVAEALAEKLKRPDLAEVPRKPLGRPPKRSNHGRSL